MPNPFVSYLVFGTVLNAIEDTAPSASLKVTTSLGTRSYTSDTIGLFMFDLADIGYTNGENVTIDVKDQFNNEFTQDKFVVTGFFRQANINLAVRTLANDTTGGLTTSILHSVGGNPITTENPLPTKDTADPLMEYGLAGKDPDNIIFGYLKPNGEWYIQRLDNSLLEYLYVRGSSGFPDEWANRVNLTYLRFNEVF